MNGYRLENANREPLTPEQRKELVDWIRREFSEKVSDPTTNPIIEACHELLDEFGIERCGTGTPCDNPKCNSKLYHRLHTALERMKAAVDSLERATSSAEDRKFE